MRTLSMRIVTYPIEYQGEFEFIFETILDYESGDQMSSFDAKNPPSKISCLGTFKYGSSAGKTLHRILRANESVSVDLLALTQSVLTEDATNVEAIACIGMNHFYSDQPELSLR
jgi:hypothetical protein